MIPTSAHLPLPWHAGYDIHAIKLMEEKEKALKAAVKENWIIIYEHDPFVPASTVKMGDKHFMRNEIIHLDSD